MDISFFKEPTAVVEYLQEKTPELHFDYDEIAHDAHKRTFTIAKMTDLDLLRDMQTSLAEAFKNGTSFDEWKAGIMPKLAAKGWLGKTKVIDPKTGEEKQIYVGNRRLKTIYNTNMRTAYAKARYESQMKSSGEYFRYVAVMDRLTRPAHARLHGTTIPKTDPFWNRNYPPNGWNCRCQVQVLTKEECEAKGIVPLADGSFLRDVCDEDFAYNPGKVDKIDEILKEKQEKALNSLRSQDKAKLETRLEGFERQRKLYVWQRGLKDAIDEIVVKDNPKTPINMVQVGFLDVFLAKKASEILGMDVQSGGIIVTKKHLSHAAPKRKESYDHALRVDEMREIVSVLDDENNAYADLRKKHRNILFLFEDKKDGSKINLIPVEISKIIKKFKQSNYVITLDKNDKKTIEDLIEKGEIKKIK